MALPNPLPDNPHRWDGWRKYNSPNAYERLCLDYTSNASTDTIEENCRQLLVWWQKKLPLKNQPSNPLAQLLRQGMDEAPQMLAEARTMLLDPGQRAALDMELHAGIVAHAMEEFKKLLDFSLGHQDLGPETEERLYAAGEKMGLTRTDMLPVIELELESGGFKRLAAETPPPPPPPVPAAPAPVAPKPAPRSQNSEASPATGDPAADFRRLLRMSRLCIDGEEMTDDQRDAMCNLGEGLGLTGGESEDLIDEYLEESVTLQMSAAPGPPNRGNPAPAPRTPALPVPAGRPAPGTKPPTAVSPRPPSVPPPAKRATVNLSPAARAAERQKYKNFTNGLGGEMFFVPSGQFRMGNEAPDAAPNEQPVSSVIVSAVYFSRFPITNGQFEKFDPGHRLKRAPWADDLHPVIHVSWNEAVSFCRWIAQREGKKYRLPTEAEWEYAARGDDGRLFPWGNALNSGKLCNFADARTNLVWRDARIDDGFAETNPVGSFPMGASPFGLEEMAGNVHEWCQDFYAPYTAKDKTNPSGPNASQQRVLRGGSWRSRVTSVRSVARSSNVAAFQSNDIGFRVVCECEG
jgi:formylglycine-generating enzyme required for sulfatase activity